MRRVRRRAPQWHRDAVGGMWEEIGRLQLSFLVSQGLRPQHSLLDIGCGSLRGGVHLIDYLDPGRYVGVDRDAALLHAGRDIELKPGTLPMKRPLLVEMADFDFARLGRRFEFALAQSLFTHLTLNEILRCLLQVRKVLDGSLYATFFAVADPLVPTRQHQEVVTTLDTDPFHYPASVLACLAAEVRLEFSFMGEWGHPRGQQMGRFSVS
jgi:SAM-dependent methyltransferase